MTSFQVTSRSRSLSRPSGACHLLGLSESGSGLVFLSAFRICFASLRETKSSEEGFRAKAQSGIESRKGESGHYGANSVLINSLLTFSFGKTIHESHEIRANNNGFASCVSWIALSPTPNNSPISS
ncbi:MAG: hypothetical protein QOE96_4161 [Blastocatellia bacterium]|nr:hypothetical protein [Blastocatellia bacterium]